MAQPDAAQPKPATSTVSGSLPEQEPGALDIVAENANVIIAGALLIAVVVFLLLWRGQLAAAENTKAWNAIRATSFTGGFTIPSDPDVESLESYKKLYRGTEAEPFILLQYANALYKRGKRADLVRASEAYKELQKRFGDHPLVGPATKDAQAKVDAEIALMEKLGLGAEDASDTPPPDDAPGPDDDGGDPGHDDHEGHDHGDEGHEDHGPDDDGDAPVTPPGEGDSSNGGE